MDDHTTQTCTTKAPSTTGSTIRGEKDGFRLGTKKCFLGSTAQLFLGKYEAFESEPLSFRPLILGPIGHRTIWGKPNWENMGVQTIEFQGIFQTKTNQWEGHIGLH